MINCIILDDEPLAREMIRMHLSHFPDWNIVGECVNAAQAYTVLLQNDIQVIFLDIRMPHVLGTEFLGSLKAPPLAIFTTAYADYAMAGFDLDAVDYLLKPITFERFAVAIAKLQARLNLPQVELREIPAQTRSPLKEDFIFIRQDHRLVKVSYNEILFLEAKRDFTKIVLKEKILLAGFHLKILEDMLPAALFMRVHRSYMVSLSAITALHGNTIEVEGRQIPVSANYKEALNKALKI
jgi:two-component system, LytTR family, response regulator